MDYNTILEDVKKKHNGQVPKPIQALGNLDQSLVIDHLTSKQQVLSKNAIPLKYKNLILLASAIVLDAPSCIMTNMQAAKKSGATKEEIMEVFAVAKFAKSATTLSNSEPAFEWLFQNL